MKTLEHKKKKRILIHQCTASLCWEQRFNLITCMNHKSLIKLLVSITCTVAACVFATDSKGTEPNSTCNQIEIMILFTLDQRCIKMQTKHDTRARNAQIYQVFYVAETDSKPDLKKLFSDSNRPRDDLNPPDNSFPNLHACWLSPWDIAASLHFYSLFNTVLFISQNTHIHNNAHTFE